MYLLFSPSSVNREIIVTGSTIAAINEREVNRGTLYSELSYQVYWEAGDSCASKLSLIASDVGQAGVTRYKP